MKKQSRVHSVTYYCTSNLPPHIKRHSPTGMNWGYGGSGPADLALSLLTDVVGKVKAEAYYQDFKWEIVADLKGGDWSISSKEIKKWVTNKESKNDSN